MKTPFFLKKKSYFLLSIIFISLYSCQTTEQKNIIEAFNKYNDWRADALNTEKYFDECPEEYDYETDLTRYSLPKLEDLGEDKYAELDTSLMDFNNDGQIDVLFKLKPYDCARGNGTMSRHPPLHILIASSETGYKVDDETVENINVKVKNFIDNEIKGYAEWIFLDTVYQKGENIFGKGGFYAWLDDDATCCPSIKAEYKTLLPNSKEEGYIDINGKYKPQDITEEKEFNKRIEF